MDCSPIKFGGASSTQVATPFKKGCLLDSPMGRPASGSLSTYPDQIGLDIKQIREAHCGWGAASILLELQEKYGYSAAQLPSTASVNRYLKEQGLVQLRAKSSPLPEPSKNRCGKVKRAHDQWELDAKGAHRVDGLGVCAPINLKDRVAKIHCISFPVVVRNKFSQPSTPHYCWTLRLAFQRWGLPRSIRVDHDSVFYENTTSSPFPKQIHLWLLGLDVELCFIHKKPPAENAVVERSHQTIGRQVYVGQKYNCWKELWAYSQLRVDKLNHQLPNRMMGGKAPLQQYPKAIHSGRLYQVEQEYEQFDMKKVYRYLAKGKWYRLVSKDKTLSLGGRVYYLKEAMPGKQLEITFCNRRKKLLFHDVNEHLVAQKPLRKTSAEDIIGATAKELKSMLYKINHRKICPIET